MEAEGVVVDGSFRPADLVFVVGWIGAIKAVISSERISDNSVFFEVEVDCLVA